MKCDMHVKMRENRGRKPPFCTQLSGTNRMYLNKELMTNSQNRTQHVNTFGQHRTLYLR